MQLNPQAGAWAYGGGVVQDVSVGLDNSVAAAQRGGRTQRAQTRCGGVEAFASDAHELSHLPTQAGAGISNGAPIGVQARGEAALGTLPQGANLVSQ
jgi:hypothetical protein